VPLGMTPEREVMPQNLAFSFRR